MIRKILFFINPISGTKMKSGLERKIRKTCEEDNTDYEILFTSEDGDYSFLQEKIQTEKITDIIICGGDGSIRSIISMILNMDVHIGIIPLGSGNGLARTAGIPNSIDEAIDVVRKGNPILSDVFFINDKLSAHVCGIGLDAKVAHDFSKQKKRGLQSYTKLALKNFMTAKSYPFTVEADGKKLNVEAFLICVANSNQFGNNIKIAPKASIRDGLLDIVIIKKTSKRKIVLSFIKQIFYGKIQDFTSNDFDKKNILYFQTKKIKIVNPDLAPLHIDGDPKETSKEFSIEILPNAYKLIYPL
ncbi:MAG: YegS/Rv2252/BmrU family lipid kinase [Ginsengibacter sp.]